MEQWRWTKSQQEKWFKAFPVSVLRKSVKLHEHRNEEERVWTHPELLRRNCNITSIAPMKEMDAEAKGGIASMIS